MKPSIFMLSVSILLGTYIDGHGQSIRKTPVLSARVDIEGTCQPGQLSKKGKSYYFFSLQKKAKPSLRKVDVISNYKLAYSKDTLTISNVSDSLLTFGSISLSGDLKYGIFTASKSSLWQGNELFSFVKSAGGYNVNARLKALKEARVASACPWISNDGKHLYFIRDNKVYHSVRQNVTSGFETSEALQIDLTSLATTNLVSLFLNKKETKLYLMTTNNNVFISARPNKKSVFSSPAVFFQLPEKNENFASGMSISDDQKFAIFYVENTNTNSRQIVSYSLAD